MPSLDQAFDDTIYAMAGLAEPVVDARADPTPLRVAAWHLAQLPIPVEAVARAAPDVLPGNSRGGRVVARDQTHGGRACRGDRRADRRGTARPLSGNGVLAGGARRCLGAGRNAGTAARAIPDAPGRRSSDSASLAGGAAGGCLLPCRGAGSLRDGGTRACASGADRPARAGARLVQRRGRPGADGGRGPGRGRGLVCALPARRRRAMPRRRERRYGFGP